MSPKLFSENLNVLVSGLDFAAVKNRIISSNIANVETPGYKSFKAVMDEKLGNDRTRKSSELSRTHPAHISDSKDESSTKAKIVRDNSTSMRADGNNVDLERELAELSANAIYYTALSRFTSQNFSGIRRIISEGKR